MDSSGSLAGELLATSAIAYAAFASNRLLERRPDVQQEFGQSAFSDWKDHYRQRLLELSAAIAEGEPRLFTARVTWADDAFQARQVPDGLLRDSLTCLREVLFEELPEPNRQLPCQYIDLALQSLAAPSRPPAGLDAANPNSKLALEYLVAVLDGDCRAAIQLIVDATQRGLPIEVAYQEVLLAAQIEVGRMWHRAEISVAEEHYVTATTERAMSILCYQAERQPPNGLAVVAAAVAENIHDIGIRACTDLFEIAGWRAIGLGGDTPPAEIAQGVERFQASLVLISAALSTQLKSVRESIVAIEALPNCNCKIMVGGLAFADAPDIWRQFGADGYAPTAIEAVSMGTRLVSESI